MKIIALKGEKDSGKSTTLKKVYELLMAAGGEQERCYYKDLEGNSKDLRDVINFAGKKIGIVTQGDYGKDYEKTYKGENEPSRTSLSVRDHLILLIALECDIVICACTTGKNIEEDIKTQKISVEKNDKKEMDIDIETIFRDKEKSKEKSLQQIENTLKAMEIIQILNLWLLDATK